MANRVAYGERLKQHRIEKAWSQEQLALIAEVSVRTIQRIENGRPASFESLKAIAAAFDIDVKELLAPASEPQTPNQRKPVSFLPRVRTGTELCNVVGGADAWHHKHDDPNDREDVQLVGEFLEELHDLSEIWKEVRPKDRVEFAYHLTDSLEQLETKGFWVFGGRATQQLRHRLDDAPIPISVATVVVLRKDNPIITKTKEKKEFIATVFASNT